MSINTPYSIDNEIQIPGYADVSCVDRQQIFVAQSGLLLVLGR